MKKILIMTCAATLLTCSGVQAKQVNLPGPGAGDLAPQSVQSGLDALYQQGNKSPLNYTHPVKHTMDARKQQDKQAKAMNAKKSDTLQFAKQGQHQQSKHYWLIAKGQEINESINLPTTVEDATVIISPSGKAKNKQNPLLNNLEVATHTGQKLKVGQDIQLLFDEKEKNEKRTGPKETLVFKTGKNKGNLKLKATNAVADDDVYMVTVLEKASDIMMDVSMDKALSLSGDSAQVRVAMKNGNTANSFKKVSAYLVSPTGQMTPLKGNFNKQRELQVTFPQKMAVSEAGVWSVMVTVDSKIKGMTARRTGQIGVGVSLPSAKFVGNIDVVENANTLDVTFPIQAGSSGRYQVDAVLSGANQDGLVGQSAAWVDAGKGNIVMQFNMADIQALGLKKPYQLKGVSLKDQSRLMVLQTLSSAVVL